jgi:hypothetical protein
LVSKDFVDDADDVFDADLGLNQVTICAELFATLALIFAGERGHHNNFDVFGLGGGTQNVEHIEATDFWHHDVADDQLGTLLDSHGQGFFAVSSGHDVVAFCEESYAVYFAEAFVVLNKHYLGHIDFIIP